jgi:hypothetical protein
MSSNWPVLLEIPCRANLLNNSIKVPGPQAHIFLNWEWAGLNCEDSMMNKGCFSDNHEATDQASNVPNFKK